MSYTYNYRLLKAAWGIAIDLTAEYCDISLQSPGALRVSDNISLDLNSLDLNYKYEPKEAEFLWLGTKMVADLIEAKIEKPIVIMITKVEFNECDYQPEGLVCSFIGWAAHVFDFPCPVYPVGFDGKYIFDFSKPDGISS